MEIKVKKKILKILFTDLFETGQDNLYFAFKTKKGGQIAHSISGSDSEGFRYNC